MEPRLTTRLTSIPVRFYVLAGVGAALVFAFGWFTAWDPWRTNMSILSEGWGRGAGFLSLLWWTAAPVVALWWPVRAVVASFVPFLLLTILNTSEHTWSFSLYLSLVACAMVAVWASTRTGWALAALALVPVATYLAGLTVIQLPFGTSVDSMYDSGFDPVGLVMYVAATAACVGLAVWMRRSALKGRRAAELEARASEVEQEAAVVGERARLARDLHDVVAHHVSLIAVRAETAPYTVPDLSPGGRALVAEIAADSRRALDELRGVLGILRRSADGPEHAPQPTASDIATLVDQARAAGEAVEWEARDLSGVTPAAGYVAYRVAQEALTNARRHAPGEPVHLETTPDEAGGIAVRVMNASTDGEVEAGRGLTGMRERVESLGGSLEVTSGDGEVVVRATIPGGGR